jgi:hypothetical protein
MGERWIHRRWRRLQSERSTGGGIGAQRRHDNDETLDKEIRENTEGCKRSWAERILRKCLRELLDITTVPFPPYLLSAEGDAAVLKTA